MSEINLHDGKSLGANERLRVAHDLRRIVREHPSIITQFPSANTYRQLIPGYRRARGWRDLGEDMRVLLPVVDASYVGVMTMRICNTSDVDVPTKLRNKDSVEVAGWLAQNVPRQAAHRLYHQLFDLAGQAERPVWMAVDTNPASLRIEHIGALLNTNFRLIGVSQLPVEGFILPQEREIWATKPCRQLNGRSVLQTYDQSM